MERDMALYYFDIEDDGRDFDEEGKELASDHEARLYAVGFAGEYLQHNPRVVWDGNQFRVVLTDADRHTLLTISITARSE